MREPIELKELYERLVPIATEALRPMAATDVRKAGIVLAALLGAIAEPVDQGLLNDLSLHAGHACRAKQRDTASDRV